MHERWMIREDEKNSPVFKLDNPIKFSQELVMILFLGSIKITTNGVFCTFTINGQTEYNEITSFADRSDDIEENCHLALHRFFNQLMVEDIKDLLIRNNEKI